jgi:hypothetical protein
LSKVHYALDFDSQTGMLAEMTAFSSQQEPRGRYVDAVCARPCVYENTVKGVSKMKKETVQYSDHYDVIVALVTYLAVCNRRGEKSDITMDNATVQWLEKYLGLPETEVEFVLENFKGLFRRSLE